MNYRKLKLFVEGVENVKKDGTKVPYPIDPSKVMITQLKITDKKRLGGEKK